MNVVRSGVNRLGREFRWRRLSSIVTGIVLLIPAAWAQTLSSEDREILKLQDQRSLGDGRLASYLSHPDAHVRYRAAIAFANIQDTTTIPTLFPFLRDSDNRVRAATGFALGQIGSVASQWELLTALRKEQDSLASSRFLEGLGRCGSSAALDSLVDDVVHYRVWPRGEVALSIARFALRGLKSERSVWLCFDLAGTNDPDIRWKSLYAVWRSAPLGLVDVEISKRREMLERFVKDQSADVRMQLAILLGRSKTNDSKDLLEKLERSEQKGGDWRVQVQVLRSLAAFIPANHTLVDRFSPYLKSSNDHVKITALQTIASLPADVLQGAEFRADLLESMVQMNRAESQSGIPVQGEAVIALAKHFPREFRLSGEMFTSRNVPNLLRAKCLEAASINPSGEYLKATLDRLSDDSIRVAMAAWDFLPRYFTPGAKRKLEGDSLDWNMIAADVVEKAGTALARGDMGITTVVSNAFGDTTVFNVLRNAGLAGKAVDFLLAAYPKLSTPGDVEAMQGVIQALSRIGGAAAVPVLEQALNDPDKTVSSDAADALKRITGNDYSERVAKATKAQFADYDWATLESLSPDQKAEIKTTRGVITLLLFPADAPFTVLNFIKLARKKFYDGLSFHRVVPNFVVQGGDPRGDGWGGPGYAIRSEFSIVNFDRGSCGIASAGKDTEGCQFFITHLPTPHLDGRYTVFGRVVKGMDVVDKLQVGDTVVSVKLLQ
ncbi:MAG: peptidylprolyl isomerase [Bacteroidota bacterium]